MFVPITEYPSFVKDTEAYLRPVFASKNRLDNCMRYLTGLIVLPTRKNVLSISRSFVDGKDQSSVNNFITDSDWDEKAFHDAGIKMVQDEVEKRKITRGVLVIDDTFSEKTGKHIEGVGKYWDHSQNKYILAHNVITTYYVTREFSVVLDSAIYRKKEDCSPGEFRTKVEIARELISKAASYGLPITRVVFDSWYATRELIEHIEALGIKEWVTQAKCDRVVMSDDGITKTSMADYARTIPEEQFFKPVEIYTSSFGKKTTYWAYCTTVRMKFLNERKARLVI